MSMNMSMVPLSHRTDPPRAEPRVRVRLHFLRPGGHTVAGLFVKPSKDMTAEIECYESQVAEIEARIETQAELLTGCELQYKRLRQEWIAKKLGMETAAVPVESENWTESMALAEKTFPGSVEANFNALTGHGIRPLKGYEVIAENLPPLPTPEMEMARAIAAGARGDDDKVAVLERELAELKQLIKSQNQNRK